MPALLTISTRCGTRNARCPTGHLLYAAGVSSAASTSLLPQEDDRHPLTLLRETVTRRLALTLLAGAVLRVPAAAHAEHDGTSHLPDGPGSGASWNSGWRGRTRWSSRPSARPSVSPSGSPQTEQPTLEARFAWGTTRGSALWSQSAVAGIPVAPTRMEMVPPVPSGWKRNSGMPKPNGGSTSLWS